MSRRVRVGFIGAGFIGQVGHLPNFSQLAECEVVAIADLRPELAKSVARRYGVDRVYRSHGELLADRDVEAAIVVTHRSYTVEVVRDCLLAGKHVFSEKPMASTSSQAGMLLDLARSRPLVYAVGYMKRFDAGVIATRNAVRQALSSGSMGKPVYVRAHCFGGNSYCGIDGDVSTDEQRPSATPAFPIAPEWLQAEMHKSYSVYLNTFSHDVDLLRFLTGEDPTIDFADVSDETCQMAVMRFPSFRCVLETGKSTNRGWDELVELYFEHGRITLRPPPPFLRNVPASVEIYEAGDTQVVTSPAMPWSWSFKEQAAAFVERVRSGVPDISSAVEAARDIDVIEQIWRAGTRQIPGRPSERAG